MLKLAQVTVVVRDQDAALEFYTQKLSLEKRRDDHIGPMRWLTVGAPGQDVELVLMQAGAGGSKATPGSAAPLVFNTDDCRGEVARLRERGVTSVTDPTDLPFGTQATLSDPDGNSLVLIQVRGA